jgi:hypothetical protein
VARTAAEPSSPYFALSQRQSTDQHRLKGILSDCWHWIIDFVSQGLTQLSAVANPNIVYCCDEREKESIAIRYKVDNSYSNKETVISRLIQTTCRDGAALSSTEKARHGYSNPLKTPQHRSPATSAYTSQSSLRAYPSSPIK